MTPNPSPGFGKPGSIDPERIPRLAPHLQREAVLLLMEMGRSVLSIAHASGLGPVEIVTIAEGRHRLFDLEQPDFALEGGA